MPPRYGKSELVSVQFLAWVLGQHPDWPIIHASYTADLSNDFSRQVRGILGEPEYQEMFPGVAVATDSAAVSRWGIQGRRGVFVSTGVGGPLTGRGARILCIDDPVKNAEDADSEVFRRKQRDWYDAAARTRVEDSGGVLLIQTRWHQADLAGYVTEGKGAERVPAEASRWETLNLPAIAVEDEEWTIYPGTEREQMYRRSEGEPLWAERFPVHELTETRLSIPPRWWLALYQQQPVGETGNLLKIDKIQHRDIDPAFIERLTRYQAWDLAISLKDSADWTVGATIGLDSEQNVYLLDIHRGRWGFRDQVTQMGERGAVFRPKSIGIETTQYQAAAFQEAARRYMLPFEEIKPDKDKVVRAQLLADRIEMGKVFADKRSSWWRTFEEEALAFPQGSYDDIVDAVVHALMMALPKAGPGTFTAYSYARNSG